MIDTKLIILEGMPSTGKSTNSNFVRIQLERNGFKTEWAHEVSMPHLVLFFNEIGMSNVEYDNFIKKYPESADTLNNIAEFRKSTVGVALPEFQWNHKGKINENIYQALLEYSVYKFPLEVYKKFALEKWAYFTEKALENHDIVYIIDSALFQYQIYTFLFKDRPYEELQDFISRIEDILQPLHPCLIYFYRENTEATIDYLENDRGPGHLEKMWNRDKEQPYYLDKPPSAETYRQFLLDYSDRADRLYDSFQSSKIALEITNEDWVRVKDDILSFLSIGRIPDPEMYPQNGTYKNEEFGFEIRVDGLSIIDPVNKERTIIPKSDNEFYIDLLPTILHFKENRIIISGSQIRAHWTETGMIYDRVLV